jgi:hypothetical protein
LTNAFRGRCTDCLSVTLARQFKIRVGGIENGDLLQRAEGEFDLFITSDQNLRYQQNLMDRPIAILELSTNDISRIQAASSPIEAALAEIQLNEFRPLTIP